MKISDLTPQDVVNLILFDNTGNMYTTDEKVQSFIRVYCRDNVCPDTDIVEEYACAQSENKIKEKDLTIKRLGIENDELRKRLDELRNPDTDKIATRYKFIQRYVSDALNIIEKYSHGTADPARTLWQVNNKIQRMYYPEEEKAVVAEEAANEN